MGISEERYRMIRALAGMDTFLMYHEVLRREPRIKNIISNYLDPEKGLMIIQDYPIAIADYFFQSEARYGRRLLSHVEEYLRSRLSWAKVMESAEWSEQDRWRYCHWQDICNERVDYVVGEIVPNVNVVFETSSFNSYLMVLAAIKTVDVCASSQFAGNRITVGIFEKNWITNYSSLLRKESVGLGRRIS